MNKPIILYMFSYKTKNKMIAKFVSLFILFSIICSCDPGYEENILVINKTDRTLNVEIFQITDTYLYEFKYINPEITLTTLKNNLNTVTKFDLLPGCKFYFWSAGGIGTISLETKEDGEIKFKDICDSISFENYTLNKEIKDFNNWDFYLDPDYTGGGKVEYTFYIENNDLVNNIR